MAVNNLVACVTCNQQFRIAQPEPATEMPVGAGLAPPAHINPATGYECGGSRYEGVLRDSASTVERNDDRSKKIQQSSRIDASPKAR